MISATPLLLVPKRHLCFLAATTTTADDEGEHSKHTNKEEEEEEEQEEEEDKKVIRDVVARCAYRSLCRCFLSLSRCARVVVLRLFLFSFR